MTLIEARLLAAIRMVADRAINVLIKQCVKSGYFELPAKNIQTPCRAQQKSSKKIFMNPARFLAVSQSSKVCDCRSRDHKSGRQPTCQTCNVHPPRHHHHRPRPTPSHLTFSFLRTLPAFPIHSRRVQGVYKGCSPGVHRILAWTTDAHPLYTPCTRQVVRYGLG